MTTRKRPVPSSCVAKPCLVLGTGFHRWVLGDSMSSNHAALWHWPSLIHATAERLGVAFPDANDGDNLALHWEQLLTASHSDGIKAEYKLSENDPISAYEKMVRDVASNLLEELKAAYPSHSRRSRYPLEGCWGSIVSLNFDGYWLPSKFEWSEKYPSDTYPVSIQQMTKGVEGKRLNRSILVDRKNQRVWFPNGHLSLNESLRLGLREFGFQPIAIYEAFKALKKFERSNQLETEEPVNHEVWQAAVALLNGDSSIHKSLGLTNLPLNWVTEMMYRPVFFAGVGMSDAEVGLWWLMVQRERNLVKVDPDVRPKAYILVHEKDTRLDFWKTHPCGIEPVICSNWDAGWAEMKRKAEALCQLK